MLQFYGINNDNQIISSNLLSIENLIEIKQETNFIKKQLYAIETSPMHRYSESIQKDFLNFQKQDILNLTRNIGKEQSQSLSCENNPIIFNKIYICVIIVKSQLCMCGRRDTFKHIFECDYYSDILRKFSYQFPGKDMQRLVTYDQIYLNQQFTSIQQSEIDLQIKFSQESTKKRVEILGKNTNNKLETKGEQQDSTRRSREELEDEKNDA